MARWLYRAIFACSVWGPMAACYTYRVVEPAQVTPGRTIRVTLTDEEMLRLQDVLGRRAQVLQAEVVSAEPSGTLDVTVPQEDRSPADRPGLNTFLSLAWPSVTRIEEKRFSAGRTALAAGVGAVAAAGILAFTTGGSGGPDEDPGPDEIVVPLIWFVIR